jgi:hypothetical protein
MSDIANQDDANQLLAALGEQLTAVGERYAQMLRQTLTNLGIDHADL